MLNLSPLSNLRPHYHSIIVGASAAGRAAAHTLFMLGVRDVLMLDERPIQYNTCRLHEYIAGLPLADIILPRLPFTFYTARVAEVATGEKVVQLSTGQKIGYEQLLVATGTVPRPAPALVGNGSVEGYHFFHHGQDALDIRERLAQGSIDHAVVVGGGLTGRELAMALIKRGVKVTLIERGNDIGGTVERDALERAGIEVLVRTNVHKVTSTEVFLDHGLSIGAQAVILCCGIMPSHPLSSAFKVDGQGHLLVQPNGQTSDPSVWAAGDVAVHATAGHTGIPAVYTWARAGMMGVCAAYGMVQMAPPEPLLRRLIL